MTKMLRSASWAVASTVAKSKRLLSKSEEKGTDVASSSGGRLCAGGGRLEAGIMDAAQISRVNRP